MEEASPESFLFQSYLRIYSLVLISLYSYSIELVTHSSCFLARSASKEFYCCLATAALQFYLSVSIRFQMCLRSASFKLISDFFCMNPSSAFCMACIFSWFICSLRGASWIYAAFFQLFLTATVFLARSSYSQMLEIFFCLVVNQCHLMVFPRDFR